jgi:hypothetical protein
LEHLGNTNDNSKALVLAETLMMQRILFWRMTNLHQEKLAN